MIENAEEAVYEENKIEEMEVCVLMDRFGYIKTVDKTVFERNQEAALKDYQYSFLCSNTDKLCIFTEQGKMHMVKVMDLPFGKFRDKGAPIDNFGNYSTAQETILYLRMPGRNQEAEAFVYHEKRHAQAGGRL